MVVLLDFFCSACAIVCQQFLFSKHMLDDMDLWVNLWSKSQCKSMKFVGSKFFSNRTNWWQKFI